MPDSQPRRQDGADLEADLLDRVRETANRRPAIEIVVATARGRALSANVR